MKNGVYYAHLPVNTEGKNIKGLRFALHIYLNGVCIWTFGLQVRTKVDAHLLPPQGRYQVGSFFLSFFLSSFTVRLNLRDGLSSGVLYHSIHEKMCFQAILQTAIEINLPMISFRVKEGRRSTILLSFSI